jgi:hypothetical protein
MDSQFNLADESKNYQEAANPWERKLVNISMLLKEKSKRRKISKLYFKQSTTNEGLRDENDSL